MKKDYITTAFRALADLLIPRKCIVCSEKLSLDEKHICRWCRDEMPLTRFWQVSHNAMADKFNDGIQKKLEMQWDRSICEDVGKRRHERYAFAAALFFFNNDADYKRIPYRIKYEDDIPAGRHFGAVLGQMLSQTEWAKDIDVIIPVPLHWRRRWKRGYNQAEVIAEGVADELGVPVCCNILKRTRNTKTQVKLDIAKKSSNVEGAFSATFQEGISHILLIDDVFTTGSTLGECFWALREVFPPSVRISVATLGFVGRA